MKHMQYGCNLLLMLNMICIICISIKCVCNNKLFMTEELTELDVVMDTSRIKRQHISVRRLQVIVF